MGKLIFPFHQFEIRFNPMLDFGQFAKGLFSPFVRIPKKVGIDNEGTTQEVIKLISEEDLYVLLISWDRIVLRYEGALSELLQKNSIAESILLGVFNKAKGHSSFGRVVNTLSYVIALKGVDRNATEVIRSSFLTPKATPLMKDADDFAITLQRKGDKNENNLNVGPFKGIVDFQTRNIDIFANNPCRREFSDLEDKAMFIDSKVVRKDPNFTFSQYTEILTQQIKMIKEYGI